MDNVGKPVLVCGGAGYIGSHIVRHLLEKGDFVVVVDDLSVGHLESLPKNCRFHKASIGNRKTLGEIFGSYEIQAVVHLCANAYVGESVSNPRKYYSNNIGNGLVLLETMLDYGVRQFVFSSSCTVYGYPERVPVDEECNIAPISPYGHTKAIFEQILADFERAYGLKYCTLRYFNAAGATPKGTIGEDHDPETHLIPLVLRQALSREFPHSSRGLAPSLQVFGGDYKTPDGTCVRDYIHVVDLANAHRLALEYLQNGGTSVAMNLANEEGHSVLDVIRACEEVTGHAIPYEVVPRRPGDPDRLIGSANKAEAILGWRPRSSDIHTIVGTAWKWHREHPHGFKNGTSSSEPNAGCMGKAVPEGQ